ncbi:MAG TPA: DUF421 domain-containing protein [Thermoanaerobacterales bacterium]|nr:DUF421 domain-containing protein [Thermoanaerobacterales bacterium]
MLISIVRTIIIYALVVAVVRVMGKRQIGQLQPFELVVTIMISELASIPMQDTDIPLLRGITPIIVLLTAQVVVSYFSMKYQPFRSLVCGNPSIVIRNGKVQEKELWRLGYCLNDLIEQMRVKNYPNLNEVEFAFLETNGEISIIPKAEHTPPTVKDINVKVQKPKLPVTLVLDGVTQTTNLKAMNISEAWLSDQLKAFNIKKSKDALIALLDTSGNFFAQTKYEAEKNKDKR